MAVMADRSSPAQNDRPSPESTTARSERSAWSPSPVSASAWNMARSMAFSLSGRLSRTSAMPSSMVTVTRSDTVSSSSAEGVTPLGEPGWAGPDSRVPAPAASTASRTGRPLYRMPSSSSRRRPDLHRGLLGLLAAAAARGRRGPPRRGRAHPGAPAARATPTPTTDAGRRVRRRSTSLPGWCRRSTPGCRSSRCRARSSTPPRSGSTRPRPGARPHPRDRRERRPRPAAARTPRGGPHRPGRGGAAAGRLVQQAGPPPPRRAAEPGRRQLRVGPRAEGLRRAGGGGRAPPQRPAQPGGDGGHRQRRPHRHPPGEVRRPRGGPDRGHPHRRHPHGHPGPHPRGEGGPGRGGDGRGAGRPAGPPGDRRRSRPGAGWRRSTARTSPSSSSTPT